MGPAVCSWSCPTAVAPCLLYARKSLSDGFLPACLPPGLQLELTDGWYSLTAECDEVLSQLTRSGLLGPGSKLRICGAELRSPGPGEWAQLQRGGWEE